MLLERDGTGARRSLLASLRQIFRFVRTVNLDQIVPLIAEFDARQSRLEQAQRHADAVLRDVESRMRALLERPDLRTQAISILDIKNLGYELGRRLAAENFADRPTQIDYSTLKSKLCTQDDFATGWLLYWCQELRTAPHYHRKIWELCYVAQALFSAGLLAPGHRGLGFGCGEEPLPSLFAKYGTSVLATDLAADRAEAEVWRLTDQHAATVEAIRRPEICPDPKLLGNIEFQEVDMNAIPSEFEGQFDFCWSTCALEHLGTLESGLKFIENSVRTLRPGGVAVHTTEFTVNDGPTIDNHPIVLYQQQHLLELERRLSASGYKVSEFDFSPGDGMLDRFVDLPPFRDNLLIPPQHYAHLKLLLDGYTCTSAGIIITA
jgi:SAM-dependent methyltransferase